MSRCRSYLLITAAFSVLFCSRPTGPAAPDAAVPLSISGRVLYPDTGVSITVISWKGVDTAVPDPLTHAFMFDGLESGPFIVQVKAADFALFEQLFNLADKPVVLHDITLAKNPIQIPSFYPANSLCIDSLYACLSPASLSDTGFSVSINFREMMDTASVAGALTILPHAGGIGTTWFNNTSLSVVIPYADLAKMETVQITVGRGAIDRFGDSLAYDFTIFYPVDTSYMRRHFVK